MNYLILIFASIKKQKLNALLTIILFTVSIGIAVAVLSFTEQLTKRLESTAQGIDLVVGAKGSPLQLILCNVFHADYPTGNIKLIDAEKISKHRLIKETLPLALGDAYEGFRIIGSHPKFQEWYSCQISTGKWWKEDLEVVLGSKVAERTGLKVGDQFESSHGLSENNQDHKGQFYKVVGILASSGSISDHLIITSIPSLWKVHHLNFIPAKQSSKLVPGVDVSDSTSEITSLLIRFRTPLGALQLPRLINQTTAMQAASPAFESSRLQSIVGVGTDVLVYFSWLILGLSGFSIFISLLSSLKDRQYDLAIMRVMGATRFKIFTVILLEGLILSCLGSVLGLISGHLVLSGFWFKDALVQNGISGMLFSINELILVGAALFVGLFAALLPALKAAFTDIHNTLNQ